MIVYNEEFIEKVENLKKRTEVENIVLELEKGHCKDKKVLERLNKLKEKILELQSCIPNDDHKKFLAEIIAEERPEFKSNNLILAPVGSGKSTLIKDVLINKEKKKNTLILVSTRFLLESVKYSDKAATEPLNIKGSKEKENAEDAVHIMTYHEFGLKIRDNNKFLENITQIFCDEIHSLPEYREYDKSGSNKGLAYALEHAMKYLFNKHYGKQIFYFTATDFTIKTLSKTRPLLLEDVSIFDYRNHPNIKKYMEISKSYITHIEQIRPFLRDRKESFDYFKSKGVAFGKTILNLQIIERILKEEGFKPLVLWSDANTTHQMTESQLKARDELMKNGKIPEDFNFLVMNSALREGWDLKDPSVRMAIMNTTNETDVIQARGRVRKDIDLIVYKTNEDMDKMNDLEFMKKYLNRPLTTEEKDEFCSQLLLLDSNKRILKWRTVSKLLVENGYEIKNGKTTINKERVNVSTITIQEKPLF